LPVYSLDTYNVLIQYEANLQIIYCYIYHYILNTWTLLSILL